jgi:hypothetical protein
VTIEAGTRQSSRQPFELQRIRVQGRDNLKTFALKLNLDW